MISVIRALAVGAIGGALAFVTGVPAPWLAGSLIATIIAIYSNQKLELPVFTGTNFFENFRVGAHHFTGDGLQAR